MSGLEDKLHLDFVLCHNLLNKNHIEALFFENLSKELCFSYNISEVSESVLYINNPSESFPEDAIVYVHGGHEENYSNFTQVLKLSKQRPDLRFIMDMREAREKRSLFQDDESYQAFVEIVQHEPGPLLPISVSHMGIGKYFNKSRCNDYSSSCDNYIRKYIEMKIQRNN